MRQKAQRIGEHTALLSLDFLPRVLAIQINSRPPFFGDIHAMTLDDLSCRAGFSPRCLRNQRRDMLQFCVREVA
jgi:hypothetical protein